MNPKETQRFTAMSAITAILNSHQHKLPPVKIATVFDTADQLMKAAEYTPEMKAGAYLLATTIAMSVVGEANSELATVLRAIIDSTE